MILKSLVPFNWKLFPPCKRVLQFFKLRLRKPLFIRALRFRLSKSESERSTQRKRVSKRIRSAFRCLRPSRDMDRVMRLKSFSDAGHNKAPFPSPITPAYVRTSAANTKEVSIQQDVEDACRSFENYLVDMVVEEGKMTDLMDIEELLHCWKNLKSPVFIDLVCRFYGELCRDLFSNSSEEDAGNSNSLAHQNRHF